MGDLTPEQVYVQHRQMGVPELEAALKARDAMRRDAEARSSFRDASDLFVGLGKTPQTGDALRSQLYKEADQPVADAQARAGARYAQALADPKHPANQAFQALVAKHIPGAPGGLTVYDAEQLGGPLKMLADYSKQTAEGGKAGAEAGKIAATTVPEAEKIAAEAGAIKSKTPAEVAKLGAEAGKLGAEAGKTAAETKEIAPTAAAERGLKGAQTAETTAKAATEGQRPAQVAAETGLKEAETAKVKQEIGPQITPGWNRSGKQLVDEATAKDFRNKAENAGKINKNIDEILKILGDKNIILNPKERARVQPRLLQITKDLAHSTGQRGLPQQDIDFFGKMTGDPTSFSLANVTGLNEAATRLQTLKKINNEDLNRHAETHGIVPEVGAAPAAAGPGDMKLTPGEEKALRDVASDPKNPQAAKALVRLKMAGVQP